MRWHHLDTQTQTHTSIPCLAALIETQTRIQTRRATRGPAVVLRLVLGIGAAILLALLSAWIIPLTQDRAMDATAVKPAQSQTLAPSALEDSDLPPWMFDDIFARL